MIRMLILLVILLLLMVFMRTFTGSSLREKPIDVDPVDASTGRERAKKPSDDDVIDVEPIVE